MITYIEIELEDVLIELEDSVLSSIFCSFAIQRSSLYGQNILCTINSLER